MTCMKLWQLRFLGKIVNGFHNNMQLQCPLIKFCRTKTGKVSSFQQGHTLGCKSGSLVFDDAGLQTPWCCFVAHFQSHTCLIFNSSHMQLAKRQVCLDFLLPLKFDS